MIDKFESDSNRIKSNQRMIRIRFVFDSNETNQKLGDLIRLAFEFDLNQFELR